LSNSTQTFYLPKVEQLKYLGKITVVLALAITFTLNVATPGADAATTHHQRLECGSSIGYVHYHRLSEDHIRIFQWSVKLDPTANASAKADLRRFGPFGDQRIRSTILAKPNTWVGSRSIMNITRNPVYEKHPAVAIDISGDKSCTAFFNPWTASI